MTDPAGNPTEASTSTDNSVTYLHAGSVQFSAPTYAVDESGSPVLGVTVTRTAGSEGAVSVDYAVTGGTATPGADYTPVAAGTLTWADGDLADKTIYVAVLDDALSEGKETIDLALSNPTGCAETGPQAATSIVIAASDGIAILGMAKSPQAVVVDPDGDRATLKLGGKVGGLTDYLTNGAGPISEIDLAGSDPMKSTVSIAVTGARVGTGDGRTAIGEIDGIGAAGSSPCP